LDLAGWDEHLPPQGLSCLIHSAQEQQTAKTQDEKQHYFTSQTQITSLNNTYSLLKTMHENW